MSETADGAIRRVAQALGAAGIAEARLEGRVLVETVVGGNGVFDNPKVNNIILL